MRLHAPLDDRTAWSPVGRCPIEKAMAVVGSRPAMLLMREAHYGTRRFDDFVTGGGVAPATASTHLKALADAGLLARRPYQDDGARTRDEYVLTPAGAGRVPGAMGRLPIRWTGMRVTTQMAKALMSTRMRNRLC